MALNKLKKTVMLGFQNYGFWYLKCIRQLFSKTVKNTKFCGITENVHVKGLHAVYAHATFKTRYLFMVVYSNI